MSSGDSFVSHMEVLKLYKAKINNPHTIPENIHYFKSLRHLDLSCALFKSSFGNSKRLNKFIESFALGLSQCVQMETLLVSYCDFLINDIFVQIISQHLVKLRHLDLRNCSQITDTSLHFISYFLRDLVHLDVSWCQNLR